MSFRLGIATKLAAATTKNTGANGRFEGSTTKVAVSVPGDRPFLVDVLGLAAESVDVPGVVVALRGVASVCEFPEAASDIGGTCHKGSAATTLARTLDHLAHLALLKVEYSQFSASLLL